VVTSEALSGFSNGDIEAGFEGERRDKIIRTYIRNTYVYHLSEIFFTGKSLLTGYPDISNLIAAVESCFTNAQLH
jgi:hypothetical protein